MMAGADPALPKLAAVVHEAGEAPAADVMLIAIADGLRRSGLKLAGTTREPEPERSRCEMHLTNLHDGTRALISEYRGQHARGCRLDVGALEHLVGITVSALEAGAEMLIVNKFGKREVDGAGFRPAIALTIMGEIPALVAVSRAYLPAWREFVGDLAVELPLESRAIGAWCEAATGVAVGELRPRHDADGA